VLLLRGDRVSHEIEWGQVLPKSQVWRNGFTWIVETHAGGTVTLYAPTIDKRHTGTPPSWNKVEVLTPDDRRYHRSAADALPTPRGATDIDVAGALVQIRLGATVIAVRDDDGLRFEPWDGMDIDSKRLHLLLAHRFSAVNITDAELDTYHGHNSDVPHEHGGL